MIDKRGQAAGAAVLLAIIVGLIITFILLMPPKDRAELLGEPLPSTSISTPSSGTTGITRATPINEVLLRENPGRLSYFEDLQKEILIPSTHIYTKTESSVLEERNEVSVKNAVFSSKKEEFRFSLDDPALAENVYLDFSIDTYKGSLIILLNGKEVFNKETNKIRPFKLPKEFLAKDNVLTFEVSSPGLAFWSTNEYSLNNIKVVADIIDPSTQESKHLFSLKNDEIKNLEEVILRFSLNCLPLEMNKLTIKVNDYPVFSGVPENCEDLFLYKLPPEIIKSGNNWVSFKTETGDYEINQAALKTKLGAPSYPAYYFELKDTYFTNAKKEPVCGEIDGVCPEDCGEDVDKDCCFQQYTTPYWCTSETSNNNDRCVGNVDRTDCSRCPSGYEDEDKTPPETCKSLCGDDTDNFCPKDCNSDYDKNCCFNKPGEQFWCADLPISGLDYACVNSVSQDECALCPSSYLGKKTSPNCPKKITRSEEKVLQKTYDVIMTVEFTDDEYKEAEVYINGHKLSFDTYDLEFSRKINSFVNPLTNSIKIIPKNNFDVKTLKIELKS